jgi:hypothetical protein
MSRNLLRIAMLLAIAPACTRPAVQEPITPNQIVDAWQVTVPVPSAEAYTAVLGVLSDSSYAIRIADAANGTIETRPRRDSDVRRAREAPEVRGFAYPPDAGMSTVRYNGSNLPITLRAVVTPVGADSAHVAIVGDLAMYTQAHITARSTEWHYITGIGSAVLNRMRLAQR